MFGKKKYDTTPITPAQQEELAKEAVRRWRATGNRDEDYPWPPPQRGDGYTDDIFEQVSAEAARKPWWRR
jgi:hypothetical protein